MSSLLLNPLVAAAERLPQLAGENNDQCGHGDASSVLGRYQVDHWGVLVMVVSCWLQSINVLNGRTLSGQLGFEKLFSRQRCNKYIDHSP